MPTQNQNISQAARARMLSLPREPFLVADWLNVVMVHLEVDADTLQAVTPFQLDLWQGRAFVTLVAFTLRGMHPRLGGRWSRWLFRLLATHHFLNVRTYVKQDGEAGIHFLAEWLDNRLAVQLGPRVFGLPYRLGRNTYEHEVEAGSLRGRVEDVGNGAALEYRAEPAAGESNFAPCREGSLDEWLMERYTAFNCMRGQRLFFRVWHEPWSQVPVRVRLADRRLLTAHWPLFDDAPVAGANYSPGVRAVWMGWPHRLGRGTWCLPSRACRPGAVR